MQRFLVVYRGISHKSLVFSRHTREPLGECVSQENTSDKRNIPWYNTRKRCITILYHDIEIQWPTQSMRHTHSARWEGWV